MLIVHKYGGTSVGSLDRIKNVANRVSKAREDGNDLVVVVSAMSGETNKLIDFAKYFSSNPSKERWDIVYLVSGRDGFTAFTTLQIAV